LGHTEVTPRANNAPEATVARWWAIHGAKNMMLSVPQIARMTCRSRRTIIRWFENEPGTLFVADNPETLHKRRHRTLRVPRDVFERVIARKKIVLICA